MSFTVAPALLWFDAGEVRHPDPLRDIAPDRFRKPIAELRGKGRVAAMLVDERE